MAALVGAPAQAAPRPAGFRPTPSTVEAGIWDLANTAERHLRHSGDINNDVAFNTYVRGVACKLSNEYCGDLRIYVLNRPFFNAMMAPNGYSEVWSGILLRCENEAELAFVLGHEIAHFTENHSLERHQANKTRANVGLALSVGVAVLGAAAASGAPDAQSAQSIMNSTGNLIDAIYLGGIATLFAFSRENESEADALGFSAVVRAGYSPKAGAAVWKRLMEENGQSDFEKVRKRDRRLGVFDSHPLSATRVAALEEAAAKHSAAGEEGRARYRAAIRPFLAAWLRDDLRRRDFGQTLYVLSNLEGSGQDLGVINFYRGETYRLRNRAGDLALAGHAYALATTQADSPVATWRELGNIQRKLGDSAGARTALETYLSRAPDAEDAWMVRETLASLSGAV